MNDGSWTSVETAKFALEILKVIVSIATPIAVLIIGLWVRQAVGHIETAEWANQKLIEAKLNFYDKVGPGLNDIYCYFLYVGDWKKMSPVDVLNQKRDLHRKFDLARPILKRQTQDRFITFIRACFEEYRGKGLDAGLLASCVPRKDAYVGHWDPAWDCLFVAIDDANDKRRDIEGRYRELMEQLAIEFDPKNETSTRRATDLQRGSPEQRPAAENVVVKAARLGAPEGCDSPPADGGGPQVVPTCDAQSPPNPRDGCGT
jgi:hypothetical protein